MEPTALVNMSRAALIAEFWERVHESWQRPAFDEYCAQLSDNELRRKLARFRGGRWLPSQCVYYDQ